MQLLAVNLVGKAVQAVVFSVYEHFDECSFCSVKVVVRVVVVRQAVHGVPEVEAQAVAHSGLVDVHGVEYYVAVAAHSHYGSVGFLVVLVPQFHAERFFGVCGGCGAAYLYSGVVYEQVVHAVGAAPRVDNCYVSWMSHVFFKFRGVEKHNGQRGEVKVPYRACS